MIVIVNVFIIIYGENSKTEKIALKKDSGDPFERKQTDVIKIKALNVKEIKKINISHDGKSVGDGWYLEEIKLSFDQKSYKLVKIMNFLNFISYYYFFKLQM